MGLLAAPSAVAHPSVQAPYDRFRVVQGFAGEQRTVLHARWPAAHPVPDPRTTGVRVRLDIEPGDAIERVIDLPASGWVARRASRYAASGCNRRPIRARLRAGRGGGRFALALPGCGTPLVPAGTVRVAVLVTAGDARWCADVTSFATRGQRLSGSARRALAGCPCEPLPGGALAALGQRVFARHGCTVPGCHGGAFGQAGLSLSPELAYASLVGVPSTIDPARVRVVPGDPASSLLWQKVAARTVSLGGVPGLGMPIGDPAVDADELAALELWIAAGAPGTGPVRGLPQLLDCGSGARDAARQGVR